MSFIHTEKGELKCFSKCFIHKVLFAVLIPEDETITSKPQIPHTKSKESAPSDVHRGMKMRSTVNPQPHQ